MASRRQRRDPHASRGPEPFDDGFDPRRSHLGNARSRRGTDHRARSVCKQVFRTLSLALGGECSDTLLQGLEVVAVEPAPDATHFLVTLRTPHASEAVSVKEILDRLNRIRGFLRSEVAGVITRRRAPDLSFRVLPREPDPR